jgi:hypothetical protein
MKETGMSREVNSESESKSSEKGEPKKGGKTFLERAKNYMPAWEMPTLKAAIEVGAKAATFALAVQAVGASGFESRSLMSESSDSALAPMDSKGLTDQKPSFQVAPNQRANFIGTSLPEPYVPPEGFSSYKGPAIKDIWRNAHKEYVEGVEEAPEGLHQGEAQGKGERETALDFRSRKVIPGGEMARSAMEAPVPQQGQDKSKGVEDLELSREEIGTLKSFADSLKEHPEARKCLQKVRNDKETMDSIKDLIQDEEVRRCAISELKNKGNVEQAILLWEKPKALQVFKKVLNNKEYMETFRNLIQDKEFRGRGLYSLEGTQKSSLARRMIQEVDQPAEPPSADDNPHQSYSNLIFLATYPTVIIGVVGLFLCQCRIEQEDQNEQGNRSEQGDQGEQRGRPEIDPFAEERNRLITEFANQNDKLTFGSDSEQSSVYSDGEQSVIQVSRSDSCNKRPNGPENENERFMVWLALAKMKGETIKAHERLAKDNPERFEELKKWASEEFEEWKKQKLEVEQGISRSLTRGAPSSSLCPEGSSSEPVPPIGIEMSPLPSERVDFYANTRAMERAAVRSMIDNNESRMSRRNDEEATTSATVPSLESSNKGKQPVSVYDDPGPLSRTSSTSSSEYFSPEHP